jgi:fatty-acyl-CoA synthase
MTLAHLIGPPATPNRHPTVIEMLRAASLSRCGLAFVDVREHEQKFSYGELWDRAGRMATALAELGIQPGDRVALCLPTSVDFMDAFFGALAAGAVPVPLYPPVRLGRLDEYHSRTARMLEVSGARVLLTDSRVIKLLGVAALRAKVPLGCREVSSLLSRGKGATLRERSASDLALIQFSSGSTVEPKPVALSNGNLLANVAAIDRFLPEGGPFPQRGASWLPLYHDMGLIGCLLLGVGHPGDLTLIPPELFLARPALWLRAISRDKATVSPAPNFAFGLCVKRVRDEDLAGCDLSSWSLALDGAEPIAAEPTRAFIGRFAKWGFNPRALTPVYGLSEASLAVTFTARGAGLRSARLDGDLLAKAGEVLAWPGRGASREIVSVGAPLAGVEVRIDAPLEESPDAAPEPVDMLQENRVGRVRVRGPSVMQGYFGPDGTAPYNRLATARVLRDGWLDTGDLGFVRDGELFICGRAKELVILRGKNHAPQEFEEALDGLDGVRAGCAIAVGYVPENGEGEELGMLVERDAAIPERPPHSDAELAELITARVVERTQVRPHRIELLAPGTLPRTSSGKLRRAEALRQMLAGELRAPTKVTMAGVVGEVAKSFAARAILRAKNALEPGE